MEKKEAVSGLVQDGQQAIVIVLLAKNENKEPISRNQKDAAASAAAAVLERVGAEVDQNSTAIMFDPTSVGEVAKLTAIIETIIPGTEPAPEPDEEPTDVDENDVIDDAEEPEAETEE